MEIVIKYNIEFLKTTKLDAHLTHTKEKIMNASDISV